MEVFRMERKIKRIILNDIINIRLEVLSGTARACFVLNNKGSMVVYHWMVSFRRSFVGVQTRAVILTDS